MHNTHGNYMANALELSNRAAYSSMLSGPIGVFLEPRLQGPGMKKTTRFTRVMTGFVAVCLATAATAQETKTAKAPASAPRSRRRRPVPSAR